MPNSNHDNRRSKLQAKTGLSTSNITDLSWAFYSANSGLTPVSHYSISDHQKAYYTANSGGSVGSITTIETTYMKARGASGNNYDDLSLDFWTNFGPL